MNETNWQDILSDIEEQQAVLLLGHGFLAGAQSNLHDIFQKTIGEKLLHFYQRDGLFLFADNDAKTIAQKEAARFYRQASPDEELLKKIAQLPFRLIVSANPDRSLPDAFAQYRLPHQFDYYSSQPKEREEKLDRPTTERPLLYNLCGCYEDRKSLLLDYDDLFNLLKNLLADNNVPVSEVRRPLQSATTFIFFGFHFERWYTQLFLRYLNQNEHQFSNHARNYALKTTFADADTQSFFMKQFNVRYIGGDTAFFEELHRRFSEKYPERLRRLVEELSPTAATVVQLIERNDIDGAISMIKIFEAQLGADNRDVFSQTQSIYNQYMQEKQEPTISQEHLTNLLNLVRKNLRYLAQKLK
jgi:hypothetical protein